MQEKNKIQPSIHPKKGDYRGLYGWMDGMESIHKDRGTGEGNSNEETITDEESKEHERRNETSQSKNQIAAMFAAMFFLN